MGAALAAPSWRPKAARRRVCSSGGQPVREGLDRGKSLW